MDSLAQRYHCLPSHAWQHADVLDYVVMTTAQGWHAEHERRQQPREAGARPPPPTLLQQDLEAMLARARGRHP